MIEISCAAHSRKATASLLSLGCSIDQLSKLLRIKFSDFVYIEMVQIATAQLLSLLNHLVASTRRSREIIGATGGGGGHRFRS